MKAIEADSQFLSSKFVMDYSLLCGFDQANDELIVGIIGKKNIQFLISSFEMICYFKKRLFESIYLG